MFNLLVWKGEKETGEIFYIGLVDQALWRSEACRMAHIIIFPLGLDSLGFQLLKKSSILIMTLVFAHQASSGTIFSVSDWVNIKSLKGDICIIELQL